MKRIFAIAALASLAAIPARSAEGPRAERVVIIGVDGLAPFGIDKAETPVIDGLMKEGARTFHARAVMPTSSSPNWASMISGAGPEQHGVTDNDWEREKRPFEPVCKAPEGIFPTIFGELRRQRPDAHIAVFHDWDAFGRLAEKTCCDTLEDCKGAIGTADRAAAYFKEKKPTLMFVHLDNVDHAGHAMGWGGPMYNKAVGVADMLIGRIVQSIKDAGAWETTAVILTSDHGGKGKSHGGNTIEELEIPWIITGPGVAAGKEIEAPVNTYDTAATAAMLLGIEPHACWIARPVMAAFQM